MYVVVVIIVEVAVVIVNLITTYHAVWLRYTVCVGTGTDGPGIQETHTNA